MFRLFIFTIFAFSQSIWAQSSCLQVFKVPDPLFQGLVSQNLEVIQTTGELKANAPLEQMNNKTESLAQQLRYKADTSSVSTLLYVASGYDAATPFKLIPHLQRVIGIDEHPFVLSKMQKVIVKLPEEKNPDYSTVTSVNTQKYLASAILGRLFEAFPDIRVRSVEAMNDGAYTHGRVRFDRGEGTPLQEYIHLHTEMPGISGVTEKPVQVPFLWGKALQAEGYQALLIKASMSLFIKNPEALKHFVVPLVQNKGLLIDVDGVRLENSFDLYQMLGKSPNYTRQDLKVERYGYGSSSSTVLIPHVTQFE